MSDDDFTVARLRAAARRIAAGLPGPTPDEIARLRELLPPPKSGPAVAADEAALGTGDAA